MTLSHWGRFLLALCFMMATTTAVSAQIANDVDFRIENQVDLLTTSRTEIQILYIGSELPEGTLVNVELQRSLPESVISSGYIEIKPTAAKKVRLRKGSTIAIKLPTRNISPGRYQIQITPSLRQSPAIKVVLGDAMKSYQVDLQLVLGTADEATTQLLEDVRLAKEYIQRLSVVTDKFLIQYQGMVEPDAVADEQERESRFANVNDEVADVRRTCLSHIQGSVMPHYYHFLFTTATKMLGRIDAVANPIRHGEAMPASSTVDFRGLIVKAHVELELELQASIAACLSVTPARFLQEDHFNQLACEQALLGWSVALPNVQTVIDGVKLRLGSDLSKRLLKHLDATMDIDVNATMKNRLRKQLALLQNGKAGKALPGIVKRASSCLDACRLWQESKTEAAGTSARNKHKAMVEKIKDSLITWRTFGQ